MTVRAGKGLKLKGTGSLTLLAVLSPTEERPKCIPLAVLTGSNPDKDILRTCDLRARCYITRPVDFLRRQINRGFPVHRHQAVKE